MKKKSQLETANAKKEYVEIQELKATVSSEIVPGRLLTTQLTDKKDYELDKQNYSIQTEYKGKKGKSDQLQCAIISASWDASTL